MRSPGIRSRDRSRGPSRHRLRSLRQRPEGRFAGPGCCSGVAPSRNGRDGPSWSSGDSPRTGGWPTPPAIGQWPPSSTPPPAGRFVMRCDAAATATRTPSEAWRIGSSASSAKWSRPGRPSTRKDRRKAPLEHKKTLDVVMRVPFFHGSFIAPSRHFRMPPEGASTPSLLEMPLAPAAKTPRKQAPPLPVRDSGCCTIASAQARIPFRIRKTGSDFGGGNPSAACPSASAIPLYGLGIRSRPLGRLPDSLECLGAPTTLDYPPPFLAGISA